MFWELSHGLHAEPSGEDDKESEHGLMELIIGMPSKTGFVWNQTASAIAKATNIFTKRGDSLHQITIVGDPYVHCARDAIVDRFLKRGTAEYLLFIDDDVVFDPSDIDELIKAKKGIVGGTYPQKKIEFDLIKANAGRYSPGMLNHVSSKSHLFLGEGEHEMTAQDLLKPMEAEGLAGGFMMVHRDVLLAHLNDFGEPYVNVRYGEGPMAPFFYFGVHQSNRGAVGEDIQFCLRMRELGEKVWVLPWVTLGHVGYHVHYGCAPCATGEPIHRMAT